MDSFIVGFNAPKVHHLGYEERRGGGLRIDFGRPVVFNGRRNVDTRAFLIFASTRKAATSAEVEPASCELWTNGNWITCEQIDAIYLSKYWSTIQQIIRN